MPDGFDRPRSIVRTLDDLPAEAPVVVVRPITREATPAHLAQSDGSVTGADGHALHYRAGEHFIVEHRTGEVRVVRKDIFEKTYHQIGPGLYRKRASLRLRATVADRDLEVETLEGVKTARRGDWIMIGVADELWPVPAMQAKETYRQVAIVTAFVPVVIAILALSMLAAIAVALA